MFEIIKLFKLLDVMEQSCYLEPVEWVVIAILNIEHITQVLTVSYHSNPNHIVLNEKC